VAWLSGGRRRPEDDLEEAWTAFSAALTPPFELSSWLLALLRGLARLLPAEGYYAYFADTPGGALVLRATSTAVGTPTVGPNYAGLVTAKPLQPAPLESALPGQVVDWESGANDALLVRIDNRCVLRASQPQTRPNDARARQALAAYVGRVAPTVAVLVEYASAAVRLDEASLRAVTQRRAVEIAFNGSRLLAVVARLTAQALDAPAAYLATRADGGECEIVWQGEEAQPLLARLGPDILMRGMAGARAAIWQAPALPGGLVAHGFALCGAAKAVWEGDSAIVAFAGRRPPERAETARALLTALSDTATSILRDQSATLAATRGYVQSLVAMADLLDLANPFAPAHSRDVATVARDLALELRLGAEAAEELLLAGRLHDIGMASIGLDLPMRHGALAESEREVVRSHPTVGADLLAGLPPQAVPARVESAIRCHHERYDGLGYPAGLVADTIPLEGRIMAVAEQFVGRSSARSYRPGMPAGRVLFELNRAAGTELDPRIVRALASIYKRRGIEPTAP